MHQQKSSAEEFLEEIEVYRNSQLERTGTQLSQALRHEKAFDYSSAIQTLEPVPELLHKANIPQQTLVGF